MARSREKIQFANACVRALNALEKMEKEKPKKFKEDLDEMAKSIISKWYASYNPNRYNRLRSLYQAYKIERDGVDVKIIFDSSFISDYNHHQDNEIIYNNVVYEGYHGGSGGTDRNKITVTKPYWRKPYRIYSHWDEFPAPKSTSPYKAIMKKTDSMMDDYKKSWETDLMKKVLSPIQRSLGGLNRK